MQIFVWFFLVSLHSLVVNFYIIFREVEHGNITADDGHLLRNSSSGRIADDMSLGAEGHLTIDNLLNILLSLYVIICNCQPSVVDNSQPVGIDLQPSSHIRSDTD